jgi:hypothetical protein
MRMVKRNPFLSGLCAVLGGAFLLAGMVGTAVADVTSDEAAAILIFPKLRLDTELGLDTVIQLSNTSAEPINVRCFYVNANSHCSNDPEEVCKTSDDCGGLSTGAVCIPGWIETDFRLMLTSRQPLVWTLGDGLPVGTFPLDGFQRIGPDGQFNLDSAIPAAPEDPFIGELKCIEVGEDEAPVDRNDLKGEATLVLASGDGLDAQAYNGLGVQAIAGANDADNVLVLGGADAEYNGCPNIIILDHFFDDAQVPEAGIVRTDLTLVPCTQDFEMQQCVTTTVQFLVFNEFEQRFSTSMPVRCFKEIGLSDIDTRERSLTDDDPASTGDLRSIFNVNVQGTLSGQTRIRGVDDGAPDHGNGLLAIGEEFYRDSIDHLDTIISSDAFNTHQTGERASADQITIP